MSNRAGDKGEGYLTRLPGEPEKGDLRHVRAYDLALKGVAHRLIYEVEGEVVRFIAIGPHDVAYARARRR